MHSPAYIYRIALIGPESSGKTTLCLELARHYKTVFAPEFSRNFVEKLNRKYTEEDVLLCIREQFELEKKILKDANHLLFADTESIMGKIWMEDVFKTCPPWVDALIEDHPYDLYLLTAPDLPFEDDPVRENPLRRDFFFAWYERELKNRKLAYAIVKGMGEERLQNAIRFIEKITKPDQRKT